MQYINKKLFSYKEGVEDFNMNVFDTSLLDSELISIILYKLKGPALPVEKKIFKKKNLKQKNFEFFLAYVKPRPPLSVHKKNQPILSSRLAGYRQHIYLRMSCFII